MTPTLHARDLPAHLVLKGSVALDTETMGLSLVRDRLCLVQMADESGAVHIVRIEQGQRDAPVLRAVLEDPARTKILHFARFDMAVLKQQLGIHMNGVYCTKIASRLARTFTDKHGLKDLAKDLLNVDLNKQQQSSDWGAASLSAEQLAYAASDVIHLHRLRAILDDILLREGRSALHARVCDALMARVDLDLAGWDAVDIFAH